MKGQRRGGFSNTEIPERVTARWLSLRRGFLNRKVAGRERELERLRGSRGEVRREKRTGEMPGLLGGLSMEFLYSTSVSIYRSR